MNKKRALLCLSLTTLFACPAEVKIDTQQDTEQPGLRELVQALQELDADQVQNIITTYPGLDLDQLNPVSGEEGSTEGSHTSPLVMIPFYSFANRSAEHAGKVSGDLSKPVVKLYMVIKELAQAGINFNVVDNYAMHNLWWNTTPLLQCMSMNNSDEVGIAKVILKEGHADPDFPDSRGQTPLYYACKADNVEAVELLLDYDADIDRQVDLKMVDNHRDTPLITAARKRHSKVINFLLDRSADANKTNAYGANALMHFVNSRRDDNESDEALATLATLVTATHDINAQTTEADVDGGIRQGESALTLAASYKTTVWNADSLTKLLSDSRLELPDSSILVKGSDERARWEERCAEGPLKHILKAVEKRFSSTT